MAAATADSLSEQNLLEQLKELKAEVVAQREVIEQLKVPRHLQSETTETIDQKLAKLQEADLGLGGALDSAWLCLCGALVMFMHAGFAMLETGCCRAKNASNVLMKNLVNVCCGTLGWWSLAGPLHMAHKMTTASSERTDSSGPTSTPRTRPLE